MIEQMYRIELLDTGAPEQLSVDDEISSFQSHHIYFFPPIIHIPEIRLQPCSPAVRLSTSKGDAMSSLRSAASRANGAKSQGPVTPQGKSRSAQNAATHGIFRSPFVLRNESNPAFLQLEAGFKEEWDPQGPTETALVEQMIICQWRLKRIWQTEAAAIDLQMDEDAPQLARELKQIDEPCRGATAFKHLADGSRILDLMQRYDRSLSRQFERALATLRALRRDRAPDPEPEAEMEPAQSNTTNLQNETETAEPEKVKLQNEPERLPELRAVLPIDQARRLLAALGYSPELPPHTTEERKGGDSGERASSYVAAQPSPGSRK
jgi:hypothetical protein